MHGQQAQNSIGNYTGALANLNKGQTQVLQTADAVMTNNSGLGKSYANLHMGTQDVTHSFALMSIAGVTASDNLTLAEQKIANLVTGYQPCRCRGISCPVR